MKQSTFGLRSSVFGLLIFLFSAGQIECANPELVEEKKTTSNSGSWVFTGLKCVGSVAIAALLIWGGLKIRKQRETIKDQEETIDASRNLRMFLATKSQSPESKATIQQPLNGSEDPMYDRPFIEHWGLRGFDLKDITNIKKRTETPTTWSCDAVLNFEKLTPPAPAPAPAE